MKKNDGKINVLHLRDSPWVDGPGRTILETSSAINKERYNYIIGAFAGNNGKTNPLIEAALARGTNVFTIREFSSMDISVFRQILRYIDENNIHILHTHEVRSDLIGLVCAKIKKIPVITTLHGWITNGIKGELYVALDKGILRFFDHIIVVSNRMKQQVQRLKISEKKISVLYNSIIIDHYRPNRSDVSFRKEYGLNDNTVLVANIGRLSPEKGQDVFIRAAREVSKNNNNVKFAIIGVGPDQPKLEQLADELGIRDLVIFTGYRSDMERIYNSLDLIVQSSHTEGMPNVITEASLMEIPVIATNVGGTSEIIKDYESGVLITAGDHKVIAAKIMEYMDETTLYMEMARKSKVHVQKYFNFCDRTRKLENLYEDIMNRN